MSVPILWHFPISHFNEKARWALDYKRISHVRRALSLGYMPRAWWATGRGTLPILFLDGTPIGDSTRIIEALERHHPDPPLYPADDAQCRRALALEDFFDEEVGAAVRTAILAPLFARDPDAVVDALATGMGRFPRTVMRAAFPAFRALYKSRHRIDATTSAAAPDKVRVAFDRVASELQPSGYLAGDRFSVADLTAAALLAPIVQPPEHQYPPGRSAASFGALRDSFAGHTGFAWVAEMYRRHRGTSAEVSSAG